MGNLSSRRELTLPQLLVDHRTWGKQQHEMVCSFHHQVLSSLDRKIALD
jgi:hypothetical protein